MNSDTKIPFGVKFLNIVLTILFVLIMFVLFTSFYFTHTKSMPKIFGYNISIMNGSQMKEYIPDKSGIITSDKEEIQPGNFALCKIGKENPVATILLVVDIENVNNNKEYYMRTAVGFDGEQIKVNENQIIGKAVYHSALLGKILGFMIRPIGIIVLLILPAFILIIWVIYHFSKRNSNEQKWNELYNKNIITSDEKNGDDFSDDIIDSKTDGALVDNKVDNKLNNNNDKREADIDDSSIFISPPLAAKGQNVQSAFSVESDNLTNNSKNSGSSNFGSKVDFARDNKNANQFELGKKQKYQPTWDIKQKYQPTWNKKDNVNSDSISEGPVKSFIFEDTSDKTVSEKKVNDTAFSGVSSSPVDKNSIASNLNNRNANPASDINGSKSINSIHNIENKNREDYKYSSTINNSLGEKKYNSSYTQTNSNRSSNFQESKLNYGSSYLKKADYNKRNVAKPSMDSASQSIDNLLKSVQGYPSEDTEQTEMPKTNRQSYYNDDIKRSNNNQSLADMLRMLDENYNRK